ncbi:hypothetical protein K1719_003875 [Acacia pycnantha]|nr:hypothetical protein K1719_003875 [Acacia pycnantha]
MSVASEKRAVSDESTAGDGRTVGDGGPVGDGWRKLGDAGMSMNNPQGSGGKGNQGVSGPSQFVIFQSGASGTAQRQGTVVKESKAHSDARQSYKDKLLCLGESGLLEPHFSAAKAMNGWKEYFAKSNEKQSMKETEDGVEGVDHDDEDAVEVWRRTGKLPKLHVNADEYDAWCKPYQNSLIVKLLGKTVNVGFMRIRMERMWASKGPMRVTPLNNRYFLVSFSSTEDRDFALHEGPWMITDHYVLVQRWRPNFNPWKVDNQKQVAVWVRIPDLPHELYNVESIRRIGNMIGRTLKIDRTTAFFEKGGFARVCVEVDLQKPLLPGFSHFGEERRFAFEGLHLVCFTCGKYEHRMENCTDTANPQASESQTVEGAPAATKVPEVQRSTVDDLGGRNGNGNRVNYRPQMLIKRDLRRQTNKPVIKVSQTEKANMQEPSKLEIKTNLHNQRGSVVKESERDPKVINTRGVESDSRRFGEEIQSTKENQEWIQVGAKWKAGRKSKARGKENKSEINSQVPGKGKENYVVVSNVASQVNLMQASGPNVVDTNMKDGEQCGKPNSAITRKGVTGPTPNESIMVKHDGILRQENQKPRVDSNASGSAKDGEGGKESKVCTKVDIMDVPMGSEDDHGDVLPTTQSGYP